MLLGEEVLLSLLGHHFRVFLERLGELVCGALDHRHSYDVVVQSQGLLGDEHLPLLVFVHSSGHFVHLAGLDVFELGSHFAQLAGQLGVAESVPLTPQREHFIENFEVLARHGLSLLA